MSDETTPFDRLMGRFSAELVTLGAVGSRIETMVGELVSRSPEAAPRELQELDLLVQSINDLAAFSLALSKPATEIDIDAAPGLAVIKLQRLRERLSGTIRQETDANEEDILF